jgi:hypothetical protein
MSGYWQQRLMEIIANLSGVSDAMANFDYYTAEAAYEAAYRVAKYSDYPSSVKFKIDVFQDVKGDKGRFRRKKLETFETGHPRAKRPF